MCKPIEQRGGHLGVAEHRRPFGEAQIGGDDQARVLVQLADQMEQECAACKTGISRTTGGISLALRLAQ